MALIRLKPYWPAYYIKLKMGMLKVSENRLALLSWMIGQDTLRIAKTGCWLWQRYKNKNGYGQIRISNSNWYAHRASYAIYRGDIPVGMCVCHSCDTPSCVNPAHLWLGTRKENSQDMSRKGRANKVWHGGGFKKGHKLSTGLRKRKVSNDDVRAIRKSGASLKWLAKRYDVSLSLISNIRNGKRKQLVS